MHKENPGFVSFEDIRKYSKDMLDFLNKEEISDWRKLQTFMNHKRNHQQRDLSIGGGNKITVKVLPNFPLYIKYVTGGLNEEEVIKAIIYPDRNSTSMQILCSQRLFSYGPPIIKANEAGRPECYQKNLKGTIDAVKRELVRINASAWI